jgi:excisionase family DNA binding protein
MPHRYFELEEAASYLHIRPEDLERLLKNGEVPHEKRGAKVLFRRVELDSWASQRILGLPESRLKEYHRRASGDTETGLILFDQMVISHIDPALPAKTKASVLREMVKLANRTGRVTNPDELLAGLVAREDLCSTGLPGGMALLHTRSHDPYLFSEPLVVLGRTVQNIPFGAPDGQGTRLFFVLGCVEDRMHLRTMARLCVMAQRPGFLLDLINASDAESMLKILLDTEAEVLKNLVS